MPVPGENTSPFHLPAVFLFEDGSKIDKIGKIGQDSVSVNKVREDLLPLGRETLRFAYLALSYSPKRSRTRGAGDGILVVQ